MVAGWAHRTGTWKFGQKVVLPNSPRKDSPYRICFAVEFLMTEQSGEHVVPLQQCVDTRFEKDHTVAASQWSLPSVSLLGQVGQFEPVSSYLDSLLSLGEGAEKRRPSVDRWIGIDGSFRRWMSTAMQPVLGRLVGANRCRTLLELARVPNACCGEVDRVLAIGRSRRTDRWMVVHGSAFPPVKGRKGFGGWDTDHKAYDC